MSVKNLRATLTEASLNKAAKGKQVVLAQVKAPKGYIWTILKNNKNGSYTMVANKFCNCVFMDLNQVIDFCEEHEMEICKSEYPWGYTEVPASAMEMTPEELKNRLYQGNINNSANRILNRLEAMKEKFDAEEAGK